MNSYKLILILLLNLLLVSCNERHYNEEPIKYRKVTFQVSSMNVTNEPFRSTTSAEELGAVVSIIEWKIFSNYNDLILEGTQNYSQDKEKYGTITLDIPEGNDIIAYFVGYGETGKYKGWESGLRCPTRKLPSLHIFNYSSEMFFGEAPVSKSYVPVALNRVTGAIEVNINDIELCPSDCYIIQIAYNVNGYLRLPFLDWGYDSDRLSIDYYKNSDGTFQTIRTNSCYIYNEDVTITAKDFNNTVYSSKTVKCNIESNHKTIISGNLFSTDNNIISANEELNSDANVSLN